MTKEEMVMKLGILTAYMRNYDPKFFTEAVNHEMFADDLDEAAAMIKDSMVSGGPEGRAKPVIPFTRRATHWCGVCDNHLKEIGCPPLRDNYCGRCGTPVDWDGLQEQEEQKKIKRQKETVTQMSMGV